MTTERPSFIVDASLVARWELRNPPYLVEALRVRDDYLEQRISLAAPNNLLVEVSGAIHHGMLTRLITPEQVEVRLEHLLNLEIPTFDNSDLLIPAHRLSRRLGCSFYDSLYLAVTEALGVPFIHADARLRQTLAGRFRLELWIQDYQSPIVGECS